MTSMQFSFTLVEALIVHRLLREALDRHAELGPETRVLLTDLQDRFGEDMQTAGWPRSQEIGRDLV